MSMATKYISELARYDKRPRRRYNLMKTQSWKYIQLFIAVWIYVSFESVIQDLNWRAVVERPGFNSLI